jgi:hypothetical protein
MSPHELLERGVISIVVDDKRYVIIKRSEDMFENETNLGTIA